MVFQVPTTPKDPKLKLFKYFRAANDFHTPAMCLGKGTRSFRSLCLWSWMLYLKLVDTEVDMEVATDTVVFVVAGEEGVVVDVVVVVVVEVFSSGT